ncbi:CerR family C-terminal domain-containing protein [Brucella suis bv. 2]|nr:CerR family C-terminal domain-containing protein [Brucella suis bv. 2]
MAKTRSRRRPLLSSEQTRKALIVAALRLFGAKGYEATSTREIASLAKANIGSIAYHFGGKEGLRLAAADYIVETFRLIAAQALGNFQPAGFSREEREDARAQMISALERMVHFIVARPETGEIVQFLLRELAHPTAALDRIYKGVFEPVHKRLCMIWEAATGEAAESEATRLVVFTLVGQIFYFRIAQEAVKRRMNWPVMGSDQADMVAGVVKQNLAAMLDARGPTGAQQPVADGGNNAMSLLCVIPFVSSLFAACGTQSLAVGYVEGEFVQLAPLQVAQVRDIAVKRGDRVEAGEPIATVEDTDARIAVAQAEAALAQAQAQLANLQVGKRPEEIAVLEAAVRSARAQADDAQRTLLRTRDLARRGVATQAQLDDAATQLEVAEAAIRQSTANLAVGKLPARPEEIKAVENAVKSAKAQLQTAKWQRAQRTIEAPAAGRITDVVRNPGDIAGPSAPVLTMLPDGAVKLKVNIPEERFSDVAVGSVLSVHCDGCAPGLQARVSYVSPDPEFTPPVIYSLETRQKLVYLVEAHPVDPASPLQPGQIVDVDLGAK